MGLYERYILPSLIEKSCGAGVIMKQRAAIVPQAEGRVLEVGLGSGLNLAFYDPAKVSEVIGLEPSEGMRIKARKRADECLVPLSFIDLPGEEIPLDDNAVDTVVLTYTLCTIPDALAALGQMRRVLKPGGRLLFSEHGEAPDAGVRKWQGRLNPIWGVIGGGCHLNRPIDRLIGSGGFRVDALETGYLPKVPRFSGFNYRGSAVPV